MDPTTFIHLSDLHVAADGTDDPSLLSDTAATLAAVARIVGAMAPCPSFVAVSGDLAHRGRPASYRAVNAALSALPCPVVYGLGNHDDRAGCVEGLGVGDGGPAFGEHVLDGVHLIVLDSGVPGRIGGALDEAQFARLDGALDRHGGLPKVIVVHHPPAVDGLAGWHTLDAASTDRLAAMVARGGVAAILSGHIHQDRVWMWRGVPVVTVSGQHATADALHTGGLRSVRGASFGLCRLGPAGFAVTFVQLPSDRAELECLPADIVRGFV